MDRGWIQFLLVAVPVVSLIGSWLALRAVADRRNGKPDDFRAPVAGRAKMERKAEKE